MSGKDMKKLAHFGVRVFIHSMAFRFSVYSKNHL